ncbi:MATE family efflux transporter [Candidatus Fermentibacteria bacterium]|nr:MATE family efflux transporter [Candidatus Fermentibacteria bacterium]
MHHRWIPSILRFRKATGDGARRSGGIDMTRGPILGSMVRLGTPVFIASVFEGLHAAVNMFWLGRLPDAALAMNAPVITFQILFLAASMGVGISQAGAALAGQARGAGKLEVIPSIAAHVVLILVMYFGVVVLAGEMWSHQILGMIKTPADSYADVHTYFRIVTAGMAPVCFVFAFRALSQGLGDTKTPMLVDTVAILLNMVLDPLLIFGLGWGVRGAAYATVIARGVASLWALRLLMDRRGPFKVSPWGWRPSRPMLATLARIGIPSGLGMSGSSLGFAVITRLVASHGAVPVAAFGLASRMFQLCMLPSMAAVSAVTTTVAQCLGAGDSQRARKAVRVGLLALPSALLVPMILLMLAGKPVARLFTHDEAVVQLAHRTLVVAGPSPVLFAGQSILQGAFQGGGVTVYVMIAAFLRLWGVRVPFAYLLEPRFGLDAVWASMVVSNLAALVFLAIGYARGLWMRRQI